MENSNILLWFILSSLLTTYCFATLPVRISSAVITEPKVCLSRNLTEAQINTTKQVQQVLASLFNSTLNHNCGGFGWRKVVS